jgi:hypothetical protein
MTQKFSFSMAENCLLASDDPKNLKTKILESWLSGVSHDYNFIQQDFVIRFDLDFPRPDIEF